jgi:acyl-coenzyme A thioesterase PaaI-like protein
MGGAAWLAGHPVVAAQLNLTFLQMLPVRTACLVQAEIARVEGRKVHTTGQIGSPDQSLVYCRATGLFIVLDHTVLGKLPPAAAAIVDRLRRPSTG